MSVLFVSQLPLGRCENLTAVWDAYGGEKEFRLGRESMAAAERDGFAAVVCDCPPVPIEGKARCTSINIGHGLTGGKLYCADEEDNSWFDADAARQIDYAIATSKAGIPIVARQFGIPVDRVLPLGMPRTDAYLRHRPDPPDARTYLYAPTFRSGYGWLPRIDWARLDGLLSDDERIVVKRHYFMREPIVGAELDRVAEAEPDEPTAPHLIGSAAVLTDYSSIMFDAYLLGIPVVLATDDMRAYLPRRGMYYSYPFEYSSRHLRVEGREELLLEDLREAARNGLRAVDLACRELTAGACDGRSAERVCELIRSVS